MKHLVATLCLAAFCTLATAQVPATKSTGQSLYLPIYSHIWHGDIARNGERAKTLVSVSVSIRNTDPVKPLRITSAQYYDTDGNKLKEFVATPKVIGPMGTLELFVARSDDTGGAGANFLIAWKSDVPMNPPVVEGLHANMPAGRSIAFVTTARVLAE